MIDFNVDKYIVDREGTLLDAMNILTRNQLGIGFICQGRRLEAVISDGDIRRWLISKGNVNDKVGDAANYNPKFVHIGEEEKGEYLLEKYGCFAIPVVDNEDNVLFIIVKDRVKGEYKNQITVPVVIMAGGKGRRLSPYTDVLPKPLLPIGEKTILERIIETFQNQGCRDFSIVVNYKKNLLKAYMNELNVNYKWKIYEEKEFLGTAGGLKLVKNDLIGTFIVSNCDVLVDANYCDLLRFHKDNKNKLSIVCARKKIIVPYGVIDIEATSRRAISIREKPVFEVLVNTGVYVLENEILNIIPDNTFIHITDVIKQCIENGDNVGTYIVDDNNWLDMGQFSEMNRMKESMIDKGIF